MARKDNPAMRGHSGVGVQLGGEPQNPSAHARSEQPKGYPHEPGHKGRDTGIAAAVAMKGIAPTLENLCLQSLESGPKTPEEARAWIEERRGAPVLLNSIRPRFSALSRRGYCDDSGERGLGEGGRCKSIRWRLCTPAERALFAAKAAADAEHGEARR